MISIPIPEGLQLPEGESEISAVVSMSNGELMLVALDGIPVGDDMEEEDMEEAPEDFMSAVERGMS